MERPDREDLGRFVREHHVHYEVEPEEVIAGERREIVAFDVRLFATHGEAKLEAPACERCNALVAELRSFAEQLVASPGTRERTEITPPSPALYRSTEVPDADEVALTVRVRCDAPAHRRPGAGEDPCLAEVRERLEAAGVPRR